MAARGAWGRGPPAMQEPPPGTLVTSAHRIRLRARTYNQVSYAFSNADPSSTYAFIRSVVLHTDVRVTPAAHQAPRPSTTLSVVLSVSAATDQFCPSWYARSVKGSAAHVHIPGTYVVVREVERFSCRAMTNNAYTSRCGTNKALYSCGHVFRDVHSKAPSVVEQSSRPHACARGGAHTGAPELFEHLQLHHKANVQPPPEESPEPTEARLFSPEALFTP
eukprot:6491437-Pyramimonas_sp.AAC.1